MPAPATINLHLSVMDDDVLARRNKQECRPICVIPARMGSKRIPSKNLQEIEEGVTLIEQAVESCGPLDFVISTDQPDLLPASLQSECVLRPPELSSDKADISDAVRHALHVLRADNPRFNYTAAVVLQPAVVARSHYILMDLLRKYHNSNCGGVVTVVKTHPWIWSINKGSTQGYNTWHPGPYPRSQDADDKFVEINAIQVTSLETAELGRRWSLPLMLYELPEWASIFDIDDLEDLHEAKILYPWAKPFLASWQGKSHIITSINNGRSMHELDSNKFH